jgi:hypothetical protein
MTLPKKKDEELTTADIAGGPSASPRERDVEAGKSVRSEGPGRADAARPQLVNSPVITPPPGEKRPERERRMDEDPSASAPSANQAVDVGRPAGVQKAPEASKSSEGTAALFSGDETHDLQGRWEKIQIAFVDEPRNAVEQADSLVATTIKRLAEVFAQERSKLEGQWGRGDNVSTEDLRVALQRYRSFFQRLLSV